MATQVLLIEDNPENLDLMRYLLQAYGYSTLCAVDGAEGVTVAQRESPDLIICDIQLPKMDGFEVARRIRSLDALSKVPLVAVTAFAMVGDRDKVLAAGFDGYISKPITPETFVPQVAAFLSPSLRTSLPKSPAAFAGRDEAAPQPTPRARILAVDNSPVNLSLIRSTLEPFGYQMQTAQNVAEAITTARSFRPDLILSDVHMPGGTGFDLIESLRRDPDLSPIPVVLISATVMNENDRQHGLALGALRFIMSPLEPHRLLTEIASCLEEAKRS